MKAMNIRALGRDTRASRIITIMLGVGFAALLASAGAVFWLQRINQENAGMVSHTLEVEARLGAFGSEAERLETARRGLLLTSNPAFTRIIEQTELQTRYHLGELARLTNDNPRQMRRVERLRQLQKAYADYHIRNSDLTGTARAEMIANFANDPAVLYVRESRSIVSQMIDEERILLADRQEQQKRTLSLFYVILGLTGVLILSVAAVTLRLVQRNLVALRDSREELRRLNDDLEQMVDSRTAELQRANAEIQRFAYIVSHDLRSPLVNVMGFTAELETARNTIAGYLTQGDEEGWREPDQNTRLAIEEDLPEAIGFIRTSTQKMDRLINAILKLSRQGRRTLAPERLDTTAMVNGIVETLQHRIQQHDTELTVETLPSIVSDRVAVEQILSNLIENALKYLDPRRTGVIRVSGHVERDRAIIEIADNGRGIDPRDHERIFDLFRRSGVQDQPGEGIGLAHVRALAYRLGGIIEVTSALDEGATFRFSLPAEWRSSEADD